MLAVDENGNPRWEAARQCNGPKEDFAFEAALRIFDGKLTLDELKDHIVSVANSTFQARGGSKRLKTLNDVRAALGGSAKDWFHELKRVAEKSGGLEEIIAQKGQGLTALSRKYGAVQAQRRKGFSKPAPSHSIKDLMSILSRLANAIDNVDSAEVISSTLEKVAADSREYRQILAKINPKTRPIE